MRAIPVLGILGAVLGLGVPATAEPLPNAVGPLASVAKHADAAIAHVRAGKPAAEAFAPWVAREKSDAERVAHLPKAVDEAGVVRLETRMLMGTTLYLTKGGTPVYAISADVWFDDKGVPSLLRLKGSAEATELEMAQPMGAVPLSSLTGDAQPLGDAALGLKVALASEGGKGLSWADLDAVAKGMPDDEKRRDSLARAKESRTKVESVGKAVVAAQADGMLVAPGSLAAIGRDKAGKPVAGLVLELRATRGGRLAWSFGAFQLWAGEEGESEFERDQRRAREQERKANEGGKKDDDEDDDEEDDE